MNGATPSGPSAFVSISANASTTAWPTTGSRPKRSMIAYGIRAGRYCDPMPDGDREQDAPGDERRRLTPAGEEAGEHVGGGREAVRAEEDPGEADDVERDQPRDDPPSAGVGRLDVARPVSPSVLDDERDAVDRPPRDECPAGAVPEPADQHRQHQVAVREDLAPATAAERDVEVVAQPARERHVPATPEVLDRDAA